MADEILTTEAVATVTESVIEAAAAAAPKVAEELPVFDFSLLSWGDGLELDTIKKRLANPTEADIENPKAALIPFQTHVCKVLISVPRSWLHKDAPANLDWTKGESLFWLQKRKFPRLIDAWNEAQEFDNASGG